MKSEHSILVIEDDHDIRVSYRQALESLDYTLHSATNGHDALILLSKLKLLPKLIILDLNMPVMTGDDFLKKKDHVEEFKHIPVIVISNQIQDEIKKRGIPFLKKPFDLDEFLLLVKESLLK